MSSAPGRFTSPDPLGFLLADLTDPQTWNLYSYVGNHPLGYVDPTANRSVKEGDTRATDDPDAPCVAPADKSTTVSAKKDTVPTLTAETGPDGTIVFYAEGTARREVVPGKTPVGTRLRGVANCAANFGNKYSIAAGVSAVTGFSKNNAFISTAFGNDASSISDIVTGRNRLGATISEVLSNPGSKNALSFAVRAAGEIRTGGPATADLGMNSAGSYFVKAWKPATVAGTVLGKSLGAALNAFTKYKAIYDFSLYGVGFASCW